MARLSKKVSERVAEGAPSEPSASSTSAANPPRREEVPKAKPRATNASPAALASAQPPASGRKKGRPRKTPLTDDDSEIGGNGIRAMVVGLAVLRSVARAQGPQPLREIASASGLTPSRVHRYLSSLVAAGFVEQDPRSSDYSLGEAVIEIGLLALGKLDSMRIGVEALQRCCEASGLDGHLSVWGSHGPTVVRWQSGRMGLHLKIEEGRVLPLLWSATGRVMAAYRDDEERNRLLEAEIAAWNDEHPKEPIRLAQVETMLASVRSQGISSSAPSVSAKLEAPLEPVFHRRDHVGFETVAVPIFDHLGRVPMTLTFFGSDQVPLLSGKSDRIAQIVEAANVASGKLGRSMPDGAPASNKRP